MFAQVAASSARRALRLQRRDPWQTVLIVASLAIGIAAFVTVFSVADPRILRPLPFPAAGDLAGGLVAAFAARYLSAVLYLPTPVAANSVIVAAVALGSRKDPTVRAMRFVMLFVMIALPLAATAAHPLAGKWLGGVSTDVGEMQIGLTLSEGDDGLTGTVETAHGNWPVKRVSEKSGEYTVTFDNGQGEGRLVGRVEGDAFKGQWDNSPMATGTFELTRAKK